MFEVLEHDSRAAARRSMPRSLLVVSADVKVDSVREQLGLTPRRDYRLLAEALNADIYDAGTMVGDKKGQLLTKLVGHGLSQALTAAARLSEYDVVFADNEYVGLFLAIAMRSLRKRPRHVVLAHHLTPRKKRLFAKLARGGIDRLILHSDAQLEFAVTQLGFNRSSISVLPYQVDTEFWQPTGREAEPNLVSSAGLECRDYGTLLEACEGLDVELTIGAASNWSRKRNSLSGRELPPYVTVGSYNYQELQDLYSRSSFVVVSLIDIDFQAGITTVLEAMAMGKAVIATLTRGQQKAIQGPTWSAGMREWPQDEVPIEEASGIYVPPSDPAALRAAMRFLLSHPDITATLGRKGRAAVERSFKVEQFAERVAETILTTV